MAMEERTLLSLADEKQKKLNIDIRKNKLKIKPFYSKKQQKVSQRVKNVFESDQEVMLTIFSFYETCEFVVTVYVAFVFTEINH